MREKILTHEETEVKQTLDKETGAIKTEEHKSRRKTKVVQEPDFVKLYIKDICKLNDIPTAGNNILNELLKYMNYDNKVLLPSGIKKDITRDLNLGKSTLDNTLNKLVKKDIIKRIGIGVYIFNPFIFGRGKWEDIKEIRASWTYNEKGRTLSGLEVDKAIEEDM